MPEGVFSNLNAAGFTIGQQLVQHPAIKAVGFTGSIAGGRALFDLANQRKEPIPFFAEMGSTNPIIFLDDAFENDNLQNWVEKYTDSLLKDAGQFCTNPGLIIGLDTPYFHSFLAKAATTIANHPSYCMLHPTIQENYNRGKANAEKQNFVSILTTVKKQKANYAAQTILKTDAINFISNPELHHEVFGPFALAVVCQSVEEITEIITKLEGQLTGTLVGTNTTIEKNKVLVAALRNRVGRLILNGVPTVVEVCGAMQHGGPYPASTDSRFGAVGTHSVNRWTRPISYQNWPNSLLPIELKNENPLIVWREINGQFTQESL